MSASLIMKRQIKGTRKNYQSLQGEIILNNGILEWTRIGEEPYDTQCDVCRRCSQF